MEPYSQANDAGSTAINDDRLECLKIVYGCGAQKSKDRKKITDLVLHRRSGEKPPPIGFDSIYRLRRLGRVILDGVTLCSAKRDKIMGQIRE